MNRDSALVSLRAQDVAEVLGAPNWWEIKTLRSLLGSESQSGTALGHDYGPDRRHPAYAFLAVDVTRAYGGKLKDAKRSFVVLNRSALVSFDLLVSSDASVEKSWRIEGLEHSKLSHRTLVAKQSPEQALFLNVMHLAPLSLGEVSSLDLAGLRVGNWVVLFYAETRSARSSLSFLVEGDSRLKYLVTGLAPGAWEIWWNGWLEDPGGTVWRESGAPYFEGPAGHYFLRRL